MNSVDRILLVEDDPRLAEMLTEYLGQAGFRVTHAPTGRAAMEHIAAADIDAVILDLMLPDMDGLDVCRQLRATSDVPVLMLTARGDAIDRIVGLEIGADDYLPKPFEPRELLARLRAILRRRVDPRHVDARPAAGNDGVLRFGRLEIDPAAHATRLDGQPCELTAYQFDLLLVLARHAGRVLSRDALMDLLKGEPLEAFDRSIDVHMSRIRAAVEDDPKKPRRIITVRGAGYLFAKVQD
ncbi:response regulator [Duganella callida]|uniref:Response regulator transcription factor n=1 Tax=Duganella callida TaxID=2561932 RepID=A0A4Y9SHD0_9BURK|nr:response regulator transcription factor [Duganella callida]TFW24303.1 response regulator transcription factor [Duganella callida]